MSIEFTEKLFIEIYKGNIVFRKRGSTIRISYNNIKKGLIRKSILIKKQPLPF